MPALTFTYQLSMNHHAGLSWWRVLLIRVALWNAKGRVDLEVVH
jgi:hypothetical protein